MALQSFEAAEVARHAARSLSRSMEEGRLDKADASPVTVADFGVQAVVLKHLSASFPGDAVCAEESSHGLQNAPELLGRVLDSVRVVEPEAKGEEVCEWIDRGLLRDTAQESRFWTLDPIDGTKGFLRRQQYALCLALIVDGEPVVAAQACPNLPARKEALGGSAETCLGTLFHAVRGYGSWEQALPPLGSSLHSLRNAARLQLPPFEESQREGLRFCESVESGHSSHEDSALVARELGISRPPVRMDSQAKYGVLSRGEAQVFLRLPGGLTGGSYKENIWDHASGALLLAEAGGAVCDIFGKSLDFSQGYKLLSNKGVVAATSPGLLERVVGAVSKVRGNKEQPQL